MILENHYQNAYITPDIERAIAALQDIYGAGEPLRTEVTSHLKTPKGEGDATIKLAFLWAGKLQYELIQPVSGFTDIYLDGVDMNRLLSFHHVAMRVDDWEGFHAERDRKGWPIALEGKGRALSYVYLDARDTLGHYLECVNAPQAFWDSFVPK